MASEKTLNDIQKEKARVRAQISNRKRRSNSDYRIIEAGINRARNNKVREELLNLLGNVCVRCGFSDSRALQFDHINGGGTKEVDTHFRGNHTMNRYYLAHPEAAKLILQILCANCNWIKRHQEKEYGLGRPRR